MINILIADDQKLFREGLSIVINLEKDMKVVGLASNGAEVCQMVDVLQPDLVLLDVQMPFMDGLTALSHIKKKYPDICVLILSTFLEDSYIVDGLSKGAKGYLLKDMDMNGMITAIREAATGKFIIHDEVASVLVRRVAFVEEQGELVSTIAITDELTDREKDVARLLIMGSGNREIAARLHITEGTVRNYISGIYAKLGVNDRFQAIVKLKNLV